MKKFISKSARETFRLGFEFGSKIVAGTTVCLYGDLGSGKTTFVQGFAKGLGIEKKIISPTFIIMARYGVTNKPDVDYFFHVDFYRTAGKDALVDLGIEQLVMSGKNIFAVEWPEKAGNSFFKNTVKILFKYLEENQREIIFEDNYL